MGYLCLNSFLLKINIHHGHCFELAPRLVATEIDHLLLVHRNDTDKTHISIHTSHMNDTIEGWDIGRLNCQTWVDMDPHTYIFSTALVLCSLSFTYTKSTYNRVLKTNNRIAFRRVVYDIYCCYHKYIKTNNIQSSSNIYMSIITFLFSILYQRHFNLNIIACICHCENSVLPFLVKRTL